MVRTLTSDWNKRLGVPLLVSFGTQPAAHPLMRPVFLPQGSLGLVTSNGSAGNARARPSTDVVIAHDIVICTYNRAALLDAVLTTLAQQNCGDEIAWRALVVDNASTDSTADVVEAHRSSALLPTLKQEQFLAATRFKPFG